MQEQSSVPHCWIIKILCHIYTSNVAFTHCVICVIWPISWWYSTNKACHFYHEDVIYHLRPSDHQSSMHVQSISKWVCVKVAPQHGWQLVPYRELHRVVEVNTPSLFRRIWLDFDFCLHSDMTGSCSFSPDARLPTACQPAPIMPHAPAAVAVGNTHLVTSWGMTICPWVKCTCCLILYTCTSSRR